MRLNFGPIVEKWKALMTIHLSRKCVIDRGKTVSDLFRTSRRQRGEVGCLLYNNLTPCCLLEDIAMELQ